LPAPTREQLLARAEEVKAQKNLSDPERAGADLTAAMEQRDAADSAFNKALQAAAAAAEDVPALRTQLEGVQDQMDVAAVEMVIGAGSRRQALRDDMSGSAHAALAPVESNPQYAVGMLQKIKDDDLPVITDSIQMPRNSVKKGFEALLATDSGAGAVVLAFTEQTWTHFGVDGGNRQQASKMIRELLSRVPLGGDKVWDGKAPPGGGKCSWFLLTSEDRAALVGQAQATTVNELNSAIATNSSKSRKAAAFSEGREAALRELRDNGIDACPTCQACVLDPDDPDYATRNALVYEVSTAHAVQDIMCQCGGLHGPSAHDTDGTDPSA
jgi:hypothetical protein